MIKRQAKIEFQLRYTNMGAISALITCSTDSQIKILFSPGSAHWARILHLVLKKVSMLI